VIVPSFETLAFQSGQYGPFVLVTIAVFLLLEAVILTSLRRRRERGLINTRLRVLDKVPDRQAALTELRRNRGLSPEGEYLLPLITFNRLLLQSGIGVSLGWFAALICVLAAAGGLIAFSIVNSVVAGAFTGLATGLGFPIVILMALRKRRQRRFEGQLPEAVDVMVRSLRAGHPVPVAISMVAREMPDPVGSEFGMVADEMTYGLDLETAMSNLRSRSGQSDLSFLVVAISIQSKTGGNLAEVMSNLSRMVRERTKVRRKILSLSAEGRVSALILSILPLVLCGLLNVLSPGFYSSVNADVVFLPSVYLGIFLWATGIYTMYRMVNFQV
jgi:tight adherence protein B